MLLQRGFSVPMQLGQRSAQTSVAQGCANMLRPAAAAPKDGERTCRVQSALTSYTHTVNRLLCGPSANEQAAAQLERNVGRRSVCTHNAQQACRDVWTSIDDRTAAAGRQ